MAVKVDEQGRLRRTEEAFKFDPESLGDRGARAKLPKRHEPFWAPLGTVDGGVQAFIGYSRRLPEGEWCVRWVGNGSSNWCSIAVADDPNVKGLAEAKRRGEAWVQQQMQRRR